MIGKWLPLFVVIALLLSACRLGDSNIKLSDSPPQPLVAANGKAIKVYQSSYCWGDECADYVSAEERLQDKEKDAVGANATITFQYEGKQPAETSLTQFHDGAYKQIAITEHSFQAPGEQGICYYALSATWLKNKNKRAAEGDSSSVFVIEITEDAGAEFDIGA